jgi:hypothetical protein
VTRLRKRESGVVLIVDIALMNIKVSLNSLFQINYATIICIIQILKDMILLYASGNN